MPSMPLVSCIMPTANRRRFAGQAIDYFLRQDYPARELIIVDDGTDRVADLVPHDERIHYVPLDRTLPLGAKRNLACAMSRGPLIAHWDDDDWIAPHRLRVQVEQLLATEADVCGARDLLHYYPDAGEAWLYRYPPDAQPWVAGCTLLYRRSAWEAHPFPEIDVGEDSAFVWQLAPERILPLPDSSFYIALIHARNTGTKNLADQRWQQRPLEEVSRVLADDALFYAGLRTGRALPSPRPRPALPSISVAAALLPTTGYGSMAEYLIVGMARAGALVNIVPLVVSQDVLLPESRELLDRSQPDASGPTLYYHILNDDVERFRTASDLFVYTMWESNRLPAGWAERMNRCRAVLVPSRFVAQVCRDSGVTVPVEVVFEGIDPDVYHFQQRPERPGITTLMVGPVDERKNTLLGIAAWKAAFAADPEARLIIKTNYNYHNYTPDDPRIRYIDADEPTRGILHWYREADVLLALGNEGFGLPLVEGMASGLPVIALNSEGQSDICADAPDCVLPVEPRRWRRDNRPAFGPSGMAGMPDVAEVAARLRWVAEHRDAARELGRAASAWATTARDVWASGPAALDVIERHVQPPRSLRRPLTLWVPTWQTACGVAEYTAQLAESLPTVAVRAAAPDLSRTRLLHIQHEPSLFDDIDLAAYIQRARSAHVPVVVTEHAVLETGHAWERHADVLVTTTEAGAARLRARCPGQRVELLPIGCPTWFPPRKREPGRVIGVFGFLERHKGFWQVLELLRRLPGTELLMFSHAKDAATARAWEEAARGLPVRRIAEFLPIDEVARRLAAEADVLVFWYDDVSLASASYAVRVGLASGVPVLASPTGWFSDVHEATLQPHDLAGGVQQLLEDAALRARVAAAARDYCFAHSWPRLAERHRALWRTLVRV